MKAVLLLAVLGLASSIVFGQTMVNGPHNNDEQAVRQLVDDFADAAKRNDADALDRMLAPDFMAVVANGAVVTRERRLAAERALEPRRRFLPGAGIKSAGQDPRCTAMA